MRSIGFSAFFLLQACCLLALAASNNKKTDDDDTDLDDMPLIRGEPIISARARAARIAEFVSSHKIPDDVPGRKDARLFERRQDETEEDEDDEEEYVRPQQRRTHVDLENFGSTGMLYEDERRNSGQQQQRQYSAGRQEELLSGVRVSSENPTTMLPVLTTQRDTRPFDFVPVNIIREDGKGGASFLPFDNKNFEDLGDVNLVPAGSNTRIQVKKGPNGKDYEYEYVYYYYDEEDEGKASGTSSVPAPQDTPTRAQGSATNSQRQRGSSNRNKYSTVERNNNVGSSSTVEPVINEVIPSANGNGNTRARQLEASAAGHRQQQHEEVAEERLPTNTRFPPRARSNSAPEQPQPTERTIRGRGNRQRSSTAEPIDTSSFRGHPEGPEFPQNLPNGPVRFLGVTPNEGNEEKTTVTTRGRARPSRIQEPAPVQEFDEHSYTRKRPANSHHESQDSRAVQQSQFRQQPYLPRDEEFATSAPAYVPNSSPRSTLHEDRESYTDYSTEVTDAPTTQVPSAMQKVALDLYAFLQQGRSNLVDFVKEADDESTEANDNLTTELILTTTYDEDATSTLPTTTPTTTTTSTTTTTTTTTTPPPPPSTEEPSTPGFGRNKFRRPGIGGSPAISRNRFKSGAASTTESSAEASAPVSSPTQRARGRFGAAANSAAPGASGSPGFKRARPSIQKSAAVEEPAAQKESAEKTEAVKPVAGRGRYRGTSARSGTTQTAKTTAAPPAAAEKSVPSSPAANGVHRPTGLNKLGGINRRRGGRPGAPAPAAATDEVVAPAEQSASSATPVQENAEPQKTLPKLAIGAARPKPGLTKPIIKPGAGRLRPKLGGTTSTTTTETPADAAPEGAVEEPASEGTEEETRQAAAEPSPPTKATTANPLNKLRNRNRIQVHPKTTTARTTVAHRRSPLLPRRTTTAAPVEAEPVTETEDEAAAAPAEATESLPETSPSTAAPKHEESRGLSGLLATRRRIAPRRPGQPISHNSGSE